MSEAKGAGKCVKIQEVIEINKARGSVGSDLGLCCSLHIYRHFPQFQIIFFQGKDNRENASFE